MYVNCKIVGACDSLKISSNMNLLGKYLDQPALVKSLYNRVPGFMALGSAGYCAYDTFKSSKQERKDNFVRSFFTVSFTALSALVATRGLKIGKKQLFEGLIELPHINHKNINEVLKNLNKNNETQRRLSNLVQKTKNNQILKFREVKFLNRELEKLHPNKKLINKVIPGHHTHDSFEELRRLSILGLIPIIGGVSGGITGDKITRNSWKHNLPNRLKEGIYQYLSNILLCNIGAGVALYGMKKAGIKSTKAKVIGLFSGVLVIGVYAGNAISNYIGKKLVNPFIDHHSHNHSCNHNCKNNPNNNRRPELIDIGIHIDDLISVGFIAGFKWIGPILPFLYSISGYRAGIGYRNGDKQD